MASQEINSTSWLADANLKAYYRFESGALTTDTSGEGHTLTAISDPAEDASGKFGGAVALDGNDAYSATDHADFKPTGNFTVGAWVKMTGQSIAQFLFQSFSINTNRAGWRLYVAATTGYAAFDSAKNTGTTLNTDYKNVIGSTDITDGNWHFLVGTWDGSYLRLFVDGVQEGGDVSWANAPAYAATNYIRVGCFVNATNNANYLTGSLDDVFLINGTALSAEEIRGIYIGWKTFNGLSNQSVKTINGLAIGSIKSFNGI
jgi:large repetitive protein